MIANAVSCPVTVFVAGTARSTPMSERDRLVGCVRERAVGIVGDREAASPASWSACSVRTISGVAPDWLTAITSWPR